MIELLGYLDRWSVRAGESLGLHLSCRDARRAVVDLVDLGGHTIDVAHAPAVFTPDLGHVTVGPQHTPIGSHAILPLPGELRAESLTISLIVRPTVLHPGVVAALVGPQGTLVRLWWSGTGHLHLQHGDATTLAEVPLPASTWSVVALSLSPGEALLQCFPLRSAAATVETSTSLSWRTDGPLNVWLAAAPDATGRAHAHFNGSLEAPAVHAAILEESEILVLRAGPGRHASGRALVAAWDFSTEVATDRLVDRGPHACHGRTRQGPTRLVPGAYWRPGLLDPAREPQRFAAIHFHSDDLLDAAWPQTARLDLPATLPSGVYGVRVRVDGSPDHDVVPCWVRAHSPAAARPLAYLAPTYTYLAYGNAPDAMLGPAYWGADHPAEHLRRVRPDLGGSLYSRHPDKSGVSLASRHRPILTIRPGVRPWGFEADRLLTGWMRQRAYSYDVLTDEDIDVDGVAALAPHRVIVTGNHPEYWSGPMLDALESWLHGGGRLVYTGGNGFYWRISSHRDLPGVIECRRAEGGTRPWIAEPGESHHQLDGDPGGLWRRLGRPPQRLVGVGFAGQGFERSAPYRVVPGARESWAGFVLDGVDEEFLGASGRFGGGAAGQEIDRYDRRLGSSPDAVVVATSQGLHDGATLRTLEELLSHEPPTADPKVRSDLTLTPTEGGGAVFSVGSMAFVGALDDPGISRVLRNVLDRFVDPAPLGPSA